MLSAVEDSVFGFTLGAFGATSGDAGGSFYLRARMHTLSLLSPSLTHTNTHGHTHTHMCAQKHNFQKAMDRCGMF